MSTSTPFVNAPAVSTHLLQDDGQIPNNALLPLFLYSSLFLNSLDEESMARAFETAFAQNNWGNGWRDGVYDYLHYHTTAHEALGCYSGSARVQFGGDGGIEVSIKAGDLVVIPAGVGHKNLGCTKDFRVVGAYPDGQEVDMCYGKSSERPAADERIKALALPTNDPIYGSNGMLVHEWKKH